MNQESKCWCGSGKRRKFCHPNMPNNGLLLIAGSPGTGKSEARQRIAEMIGNDITELDWDKACENAANKTGSIALARDQLASRLLSHASNDPIVSDTLAGPGFLTKLKIEAKQHEIPVYAILLDCDEAERKRRLEKRKAKDSDAMDGEEVEDWPAINDTNMFDVVIDNTRLNAGATARKILRKVGKEFWQPNK